jgi:hypothetical protein
LRGDLGVLGLFYFIHEGDALAFEHLVPAVFRGGGPFDEKVLKTFLLTV